MLILKYFWSRATGYKIRFVFFLLPVVFWGKYFVYNFIQNLPKNNKTTEKKNQNSSKF